MADITPGYTFIDGERGVTAAKENDQVGKAVINPEFVGTKPSSSSIAAADQLLVLKADNTYARSPFSAVSTSVAGQLALADTTQNGMLRQVSGSATDVVDGTNHCVDLASSPAFGFSRLRSYNSLGNGNFEIDQLRGGTLFNPGAGAIAAVDRWTITTVGTLRVSAQQIAATWPNNILIPGTNYNISRNALRMTLTTAQASLGASDALHVIQLLEGTQVRELLFDVHSFSLLVRSSVAPLKFGVSIRDQAPATRSLTKLATITTANTWQLLPFANLPVFPTAGVFSPNVGVQGAQLSITLAAGSSLTSPANDTWQNGNFYGALGQDNFASKPITTSTFDVAFVQWEPGSQCTQLMDVDFDTNLGRCQRYYCRSYDYGTINGTITNAGLRAYINPASATAANGATPFPRTMCKVPTVTLWNHGTGASGTIRDGAAADHTGAAAASTQIGTNSFGALSYTTAYGPGQIFFHYTADTGL